MLTTSTIVTRLKAKGPVLIVIALVLAHLAQFWAFYFQRLLPFPGDILVTYYFPWSGGGFTGFDPWTTRKALNTIDVVKQFYPWKDFAFDLIRQGVWPLWNPYSFSGSPLIANLQSAIFFPTNLVYLLVPTLAGWIGNVLFQLLVFGVFFYLFLRSEGLSKLASVFGAVVGMNLTYLTLWHWQLVITQSVLFFPLALYGVNRYREKPKGKYLLLISLSLTFCFLGGHAQTVIYVYFIYWFFALFRRLPLWAIVLTSAAPVVLGAVQLLPSLEAYLLSAREGTQTKELFAPFIFPWKNIVTVLAPDFFGHPTTGNYGGIDYRDLNAYFGLTAFVFSLSSLFWVKVKKSVRFFLFLALFGFLFSVWPLVFVFDILSIPILSSGIPARMIFVFQFAGAALAAYGFDRWLADQARFSRRNLLILVIVTLLMAVLWAVAFLDLTSSGQVARSNMILPSAFFIVTAATILAKNLWSKAAWLAIGAIFAVVFIQYSFVFNKYNSFSPPAFVFPRHPIITYLQNNAGINRFFGTDRAILDYDFSVYYRIFDFEGYDSMYPRRYGEFVAAARTGAIPKIIPRSDAYIRDWADRRSGRLLDLVGAKYLLDKNDGLKDEWETDERTFPLDKFQLLWQRAPWRIYERKTALPRIGLFNQYEVVTDKNQIIKELFDINFDYRHKIILEVNPKLAAAPKASGSTDVLSYTPNKIIVKTNSSVPAILFISDDFYPGWVAKINSVPQEILRANYTFRAVIVPAGEAKVEFIYDPWTFRWGLYISMASFLIVCLLFLKSLKK